MTNPIEKIQAKLEEQARKAGAKTTADTGVFLAGAAVGGIVDAVANTFGFVEPFVAAGLCGTGALGLKKLLWDTPRESLINNQNHQLEINKLRAEVKLLRKRNFNMDADNLDEAINVGIGENLNANEIRELYKKINSKPRPDRKLEF